MKNLIIFFIFSVLVFSCGTKLKNPEDPNKKHIINNVSLGHVISGSVTARSSSYMATFSTQNQSNNPSSATGYSATFNKNDLTQ